MTASLIAGLSAVLASSPNSTAAAPDYVQTTNAYDSMDRNEAVGFGAADKGGTWDTSQPSAVSVSGGAGHISSIAPGSAVSATLSDGVPADEKLQSTFSLPSLPSQGYGVYYGLEFRRQANGDSYRVKIRVAPGGLMTLGFQRTTDGVSSALGDPFVLPQSTTAGRTVVFQGLVAGSTTVELRARAWLEGSPIPDWQLRTTDSESGRMTAPGHIGLFMYTSRTSEAADLTVAGLQGWQLTPAAPESNGQPGPTNTGVPPGTTLTQHYGDLVITTPGATYDALDIHGFVSIQAPNVTIKRSIIRGGVATSGNVGVVSDVSGDGTNFLLADSEIVPEHPSVYLDGIKGWNYTLSRVDIHGTVDDAKIFGDDTTIKDSWLHDTVYYDSDPNQGGEHTHNDGVQVLSGTNIQILNNTIANSYNSAMQVTQGHGAVSDLRFEGNWADGGGCTVNINNAPLASLDGITVSDNRFGHDSRVPDCPIVVTYATVLIAQDNRYADTGLAVPIRKG